MILRHDKDGKQRTILSGTIAEVRTDGSVVLECEGVRKVADAITNRSHYENYTEKFNVILPTPENGGTYSAGSSLTAVCFIPDNGDDATDKEVVYKTVNGGLIGKSGVYNFGDKILVSGWVRNAKQGTIQKGQKSGQPYVSFGIKVGDIQYSIMATNYEAGKTGTTDGLWKSIAASVKEPYMDENGKPVKDCVFATVLVTPASVKEEAMSADGTKTMTKHLKPVETKEYNGKTYKFQNCYYDSRSGNNQYKLVVLPDTSAERAASHVAAAVEEEEEEENAPVMNSIKPPVQQAPAQAADPIQTTRSSGYSGADLCDAYY